MGGLARVECFQGLRDYTISEDPLERAHFMRLSKFGLKDISE